MKDINTLWFANYTNDELAQRTTEVKTCYTLKEARRFMEYRLGYITRWAEDTKVVEFCNKFSPSAAEELQIKKLIEAK
jgi:hypothetical protein